MIHHKQTGFFLKTRVIGVKGVMGVNRVTNISGVIGVNGVMGVNRVTNISGVIGVIGVNGVMVINRVTDNMRGYRGY